MTSAKRRQLLFTLQQERQKGRQALVRLCEINTSEAASTSHLDRQDDAAPPKSAAQHPADFKDPPPAETW